MKSVQAILMRVRPLNCKLRTERSERLMCVQCAFLLDNVQRNQTHQSLERGETATEFGHKTSMTLPNRDNTRVTVRNPTGG